MQNTDEIFNIIKNMIKPEYLENCVFWLKKNASNCISPISKCNPHLGQIPSSALSLLNNDRLLFPSISRLCAFGRNSRHFFRN